jgi:hypothetical protein
MSKEPDQVQLTPNEIAYLALNVKAGTFIRDDGEVDRSLILEELARQSDGRVNLEDLHELEERLGSEHL